MRMAVKAATASALLVLALVPASALAESRGLEVQVSYGGWTLAPFHPILESRTEDAILRSFESAVGSSLLGGFLSPLTARADFAKASGGSFSAVVWTHLGSSPFSLGFRADLFSFRLPYTVEVGESISIVGIPVARIDGRSAGTATIRGFGGSVLGRWAAVETRRFELHLQAGLMLFPYEGKITQDITAVVRTALGDVNVSGPWNMTIEEARGYSGEIPKAILTPLAAIEARLRLFPGGGIFGNLTFAQGTFVSAGLFLAI